MAPEHPEQDGSPSQWGLGQIKPIVPEGQETVRESCEGRRTLNNLSDMKLFQDQPLGSNRQFVLWEGGNVLGKGGIARPPRLEQDDKNIQAEAALTKDEK